MSSDQVQWCTCTVKKKSLAGAGKASACAKLCQSRRPLPTLVLVVDDLYHIYEEQTLSSVLWQLLISASTKWEGGVFVKDTLVPYYMLERCHRQRVREH